MELIYCPEDETYRIYCEVCDRFYNNQLNSQTRSRNLRRKNSTNK